MFYDHGIIRVYVESAGKEWEKDTAIDLVLLNSEKKDAAKRVISFMRQHGRMAGEPFPGTVPFYNLHKNNLDFSNNWFKFSIDIKSIT